MSPSAEPLFDRTGWWDADCREFASLRSITTFRLGLLRQWLPEDLVGRRIVDLGCGGGLLAVPLAERGAVVLGIDLAATALRAARARGVAGFRAVVGDLGAVPVAPGTADVVLLADVLEHVPAPERVVEQAADLLKPGGLLFVNTIARTVRSRLFAIALGEGLGYVPRGTHRWADFVTPEELDAAARAAGLALERRTGEAPRLLATLRSGAIQLRETRSLAVGYAALYRRAR